MPQREVDEQLAMLCHMELAGGTESLTEVVADLPRPELERLLCLAVVELLETQRDGEREVARMARRVPSGSVAFRHRLHCQATSTDIQC